MQVELKVPSVGESITEVEIGQWLKNEGDTVSKDENVVVLESEKTTLELPAPSSGTIEKVLKRKGETAKVGEVIALLQQNGAPAVPKSEAKAEAKLEPKKTEAPSRLEPRVMPAAAHAMAEQGIKAEHVQGTGPGGRILKEDV